MAKDGSQTDDIQVPTWTELTSEWTKNSATKDAGQLILAEFVKEINKAKTECKTDGWVFKGTLPTKDHPKTTADSIRKWLEIKLAKKGWGSIMVTVKPGTNEHYEVTIPGGISMV
jgi:hypothetical protein